jgi:hypothetical protein
VKEAKEMAHDQKLHEPTNVGRELTTEEVNMVAGGARRLQQKTFLTTLDGVLDILVGEITGNQRLINEGLCDLGIHTSRSQRLSYVGPQQ